MLRGGALAVADGAVAADAEALVDHLAAREGRLGDRIGIGELEPRLRHVGVEPLDVLVHPRLVRRDRLLAPLPLPRHPLVRHLPAAALDVGDHRLHLARSEIGEGGHERLGTRPPRVHEVRGVPVVGVLAPRLREVGAVADRAELRRELLGVVPRFRDPIRAEALVHLADVLRVAILAAVGDVEVAPLPLQLGEGAVVLGDLVRFGVGELRQHHHRHEDEDHEHAGTDPDDLGVHVHHACTSFTLAASSSRMMPSSSVAGAVLVIRVIATLKTKISAATTRNTPEMPRATK